MSRKTIILALAVFTASASYTVPVIAQAPVSPPVQSSLKEYTYADRNFKISLPEQWGTRSDHFVPLIAAPPDVLGTGEEFPSVKVAVLPMKEGLTLQSIGDAVQKQYKDFWVIRTDETQKLGALDVRMMTIDQTLQMTDKAKVKSKMMKMFVLGKDNYYVITATSKFAFYDDVAPVFKQVMESFRPL